MAQARYCHAHPMEPQPESYTPSTRSSLLVRIRNLEDQRAWEEFVEIYTPLIYGYCRRHDLQEGDAADVAQESMRAVARSIGKFEYDPQRGKFRNWLLTVVQNKLRNFLAQQQQRQELAGESTLNLRQERDSAPGRNESWLIPNRSDDAGGANIVPIYEIGEHQGHHFFRIAGFTSSVSGLCCPQLSKSKFDKYRPNLG